MSSEDRGPSPLVAENVPSSFDDQPDFFEEARMQKLWRKIKQEPLIPVGCLATCYALYQATKSIRQGDHNQTNRMFRARIYAQGFTLVALLAGSIFYQDERMQRKKFEKVLEDKKAAEKRDKWIKELEARDDEDRAWRAQVEQSSQSIREATQDANQSLEKGKQMITDTAGQVKEAVESRFSNKSIREQVTRDGWGSGTWVSRTKEAWRRI